MKRRALVLLLTLTLVFSYIPMAAFAVEESSIIDGQDTSGHTLTLIQYDYDPDSCDIEDLGDGGHHQVTGEVVKYLFCEDEGCEAYFTEDLGETTVTEAHSYGSDSKCICGFENPDERIYGTSRYETAIAVADRYKEATGSSKFKNIIVAYGENFPDALSGGYLAKVAKAPILLVKPEVESDIIDYISKNLASGGTVYLLGGTGVVRESFEKAVKNKGIRTKRLGGATRYDTNLAILKEAGVSNLDVLVCTGTGFADSLSAASTGLPILLVDNTLTKGQQNYVSGLSTRTFYLIGGPTVVKPAIETGIKSKGHSQSQFKRLYGPTRYETSTTIANEFFKNPTTVILASGQTFPDGLAGGPLAMIEEAPILLALAVPDNTAAAREYVKSKDVAKSITLGGPIGKFLVSDLAVKVIMGR